MTACRTCARFKTSILHARRDLDRAARWASRPPEPTAAASAAVATAKAEVESRERYAAEHEREHSERS